jgi:hypothetical protein
VRIEAIGDGVFDQLPGDVGKDDCSQVRHDDAVQRRQRSIRDRIAALAPFRRPGRCLLGVLATKGKPIQVIFTAIALIARELLGFMWAIGQVEEPAIAWAKRYVISGKLSGKRGSVWVILAAPLRQIIDLRPSWDRGRSVTKHDHAVTNPLIREWTTVVNTVLHSTFLAGPER